jgi:hypothetical protein
MGPRQPLLRCAGFERIFEGQFEFRIVKARKIVGDCHAFNDRVAALIVIDDTRYAFAESKLLVPRLLIVAFEDVDGLDGVRPIVRCFQFFEKNSCLVS